MRSWFTLLRHSARCGVAILVAAAAGTSARAEGLSVYGVDTGMVESLAGMRDFEESTVSVRPAVMSIPIARPRKPTTTSSLRSAVPSAPLPAMSTGEVFSNSKSVVPLLVGDLEPTIVRVSRPMAGRSVGARPSLPWLKSSASR